ncbi:hypothetical protein KAX17_18185 [Candidatus Bipolaricaulota bacterium]|nr:hypothetical protein [Candidatus Bipolaricaulota bacterium]
MSKKSVVVAVILLITVSLLWGCGSKKPEEIGARALRERAEEHMKLFEDEADVNLVWNRSSPFLDGIDMTKVMPPMRESAKKNFGLYKLIFWSHGYTVKNAPLLRAKIAASGARYSGHVLVGETRETLIVLLKYVDPWGKETWVVNRWKGVFTTTFEGLED